MYSCQSVATIGNQIIAFSHGLGRCCSKTSRYFWRRLGEAGEIDWFCSAIRLSRLLWSPLSDRLGLNGLVSLTSRLRFCAMPAMRNSSRAPLRPRKLIRSKRSVVFRCANSISTFLRSFRDRSNSGVPQVDGPGLEPLPGCFFGLPDGAFGQQRALEFTTLAVRFARAVKLRFHRERNAGARRRKFARLNCLSSLPAGQAY